MALKVSKWFFFCRCRINGEKKRTFSVFSHSVLLPETRIYKLLKTMKQMFLVTPSRSPDPEHKSQSVFMCG